MMKKILSLLKTHGTTEISTFSCTDVQGASEMTGQHKKEKSLSACCESVLRLDL